MAKHWRTLLDSKTLGVGDFPENITEWTLEIDKVSAGKVTYAEGPAARGLITFRGIAKPYSAGATFLGQVAALYGDDFARWSGKAVTIFPTKERAFGKVNDVIRVKPVVPKAAQVWRAKYDHATTLAALADAADLDEVRAIRESIIAQKPPAERNAEIKAAIAAAEERIKAAPGKAPESDEAPES